MIFKPWKPFSFIQDILDLYKKKKMLKKHNKDQDTNTPDTNSHLPHQQKEKP